MNFRQKLIEPVKVGAAGCKAAPGQGRIEGVASLTRRRAGAPVLPHRPGMSDRCGEHVECVFKMRVSSATVCGCWFANFHKGDSHVRRRNIVPSSRLGDWPITHSGSHFFSPRFFNQKPAISFSENDRTVLWAFSSASSAVDSRVTVGTSDAAKTRVRRYFRSAALISNALYGAKFIASAPVDAPADRIDQGEVCVWGPCRWFLLRSVSHAPQLSCSGL